MSNPNVTSPVFFAPPCIRTVYLHVYLFTYVYIPLVLTCKHKYIYTHTYMHIHTCIQLYIHELSMSYACIKYTYIAYIHICVLVEFCVSFVVTFSEVSGLCFCLPESGWHF